MKARLLVLAVAAATAACAPGLDRRVMLSGLVGQPEAEVVRQLGVPTRSYETGGRKFIAYDERRANLVPGSPFFGPFYGGFGYFGAGYGYYGGFPPRVVETGCETTLEVGSGRVLSWMLRGNACG